MRLTPILFGVFLFTLTFAAMPNVTEARHRERGERRIGNAVKKVLHPLKSLKSRRGCG